MRLIALAFALGLAALPAAARPLSEEETRTLTRSVDAYMRAIGAKNAESIVESIPPRIVNIFAGTAGIEARQVNRAMIEQTEALLKGSRFSDLESDKSALDAGDATLKDGTPVTWVIVPTAFTADVGGTRTRNEQPLLALFEGGEWYFMRIDGPQQKQLAQIAYPFLKDIAIPDARVTPLQ